jgi:hypothetical protein
LLRREITDGHLAWMLAIFLPGMGVKLLMILGSNGTVPYWDQWDGELVDTFIPHFAHQLTLADLIRPHNEHRVFWTRLLALALLLINGQWDAQLQMVVNAVLHCTVMAGFGRLMAALMGKRCWPFIWLPLTLAVALPYGWENTLWAFQSQFYFLLLFSLLTIWLLGTSPPNTARWRMGILAGIAVLFTVGSGFLAAAAVAALAACELAKTPSDWRRQWPTIAAGVALTILGLCLTAGIPQHDELRAHSLREFLFALGNYLSWPTGLHPWLAPLNLFPLLALAWIYFRSSERHRPAQQMVLGIGFWVLLQALASAYARGAGGKPPVWRYMDSACFTFIANCLSITLLFARYRPRLRFKPVWCAAFTLWALPCVWSLWTLNDYAWHGVLPIWTARQTARLNSTRAFMAANDEKIFESQDQIYIPHPNVGLLVLLLRTPEIRDILPASIREPLKVTPLPGHDQTFVTNGWQLDQPDPPTETSWGSWSGTGTAARGVFESAPITNGSFPYLEISVAGDLDQPGLSLDLVDLKSGAVTRARTPSAPGRRWTNIVMREPGDDFKIVARDDSATGWLAFKAPREMARWSYWATRLMERWRYVLAAGFVCLAWATGCWFLQGKDSEV